MMNKKAMLTLSLCALLNTDVQGLKLLGAELEQAKSQENTSNTVESGSLENN